MDEARDCIRVMLQQEEGVFYCPDYLSEEWILEQWSCAEKLQSVENCVNLVSELSLEPPPPPGSSNMQQQQQQTYNHQEHGVGRCTSRRQSLIRTKKKNHPHYSKWNPNNRDRKIALEKSPSSIIVMSNTNHSNNTHNENESRWGHSHHHQQQQRHIRRSSSSSSSYTYDEFSSSSSSSLSSSPLARSPTMLSYNKSLLLDQIRYIDPWRHQMCEWAFKAVYTFHLDGDVVALSFQILDRYLANKVVSALPLSSPLVDATTATADRSSCRFLSREEFQLYSMTALYLVVKLVEPCHKLSLDSLKDMSRGYYSNEDIATAERNMLQDLDWSILGPTPFAFLVKFVEGTSLSWKVQNWTPSSSTTTTTTISSSPSCTFMDQCRRYTELVVQDSFFLSKKQSSIAIGTILLCARQSQQHQQYEYHGRHHSRKDGQVRLTEQDVEQFIKEVEDICDDQNSFVDVMDVYHHLAARV